VRMLKHKQRLQTNHYSADDDSEFAGIQENETATNVIGIQKFLDSQFAHMAPVSGKFALSRTETEDIYEPMTEKASLKVPGLFDS